MNIKLYSLIMVCIFALAGALISDASHAVAKTTKLESYHTWLQGDWGQMNKDGSVVKMRGCAVESATPDLLRGKLGTQYDLKIGHFYNGVISFGIMDENLHIISNFTAPDYMFKKASNYLRDSTHTKLVLTPGVDNKGFVTFNFDQDMPGIANRKTIIPLTNNSFKLVAKANDLSSNAMEYFFTRCVNS